MTFFIIFAVVSNKCYIVKEVAVPCVNYNVFLDVYILSSYVLLVNVHGTKFLFVNDRITSDIFFCAVPD